MQPPVINVTSSTPKNSPLKGHLIVFEKPKKQKKGKKKGEKNPASDKNEDAQTIEVYIPSTLK